MFRSTPLHWPLTGAPEVNSAPETCARNTVGATNTAAIARNAIAMPPVNWVAIGWRREIAGVVDIIGRGSFFCLVVRGESLIVGHRCVFVNRGGTLIERLICPYG